MNDSGSVPRGVARAIVKCLQQNGVEHVFFMTGGDQAFWIESKTAGLSLILARSEQSAAYMADGYARASGGPGVVYAQWGPGAGNVAGALADPWWGRSPVVAITSSMATDTAYLNEYQELDQLPLFEPVTKWNRVVTRAERSAEMVQTAIRVATSGCPRPVHLDIPRDFFDADGPIADDYALAARDAAPAPTAAALEQALAALQRAERPLIVAGAGVRIAGAERELLAFAEETGIPVATSAGGKGALSETHPLAVGVAGRYSRKVANEALAAADVVLVVGSSLGGLITDGYRMPADDAAIVHVDIDVEQLGMVRPATVAIHADAALALDGLLTEARRSPLEGSHRPWVDELEKRVAEWRSALAAEARKPDGDGFVRGEAIVQALRDVAADDDLIVADTAYMAAWTAALYEIRKAGRTYLRCGGSLGWAFPAALGAQLARPDVRVFCVIGDGGIGYHIGDIETAVRLGIPAITLVFNNSSLAYEYQFQKHVLGGPIIDEVNDFAEVDHAAVARAFGARGARVTTAEALRAALAEAVEANEPTVIDVVVSKEQPAPVTSYESVFERTL